MRYLPESLSLYEAFHAPSILAFLSFSSTAGSKPADRNYKLLLSDPKHPSLHFKPLGTTEKLCSVRVGLSYRALGRESNGDVYWFWIGTHADYDRLIRK